MAFDPDEARAGRIDDHLNAALGAIGLPVPALAAIGYGVVIGQQTIEVFGFKLSTVTATTATCAVIAALLFHAGRCLVVVAALIDRQTNPAPSLFKLRTHPSTFNPFLAIDGQPPAWLDYAGVALIGLLIGVAAALQTMFVAFLGGPARLSPPLWAGHAALLAANALATLAAAFLFRALQRCFTRICPADARRRMLVCALAACLPIVVATAVHLRNFVFG